MKNKIYPYIVSIALVIIVTFFGVLVGKTIAPTNIVIFYLLIVVITAVWWGRGPSVMVSLLSILAFDYFLVPPYLNFAVSDFQYIFTFIGFLIVGLVIGALASKTRQQAIEAQEKESQVTILYRLSKDLAVSDSLEEALRTIRMNLGQIFNCHAAIFLPVGSGIELSSFDSEFPVEEHERTIAEWVFRNGKEAGWSTDILPGAKALYLPLETSHGVFGVLGVFFEKGKEGLDSRENSLLNALASQAAVAVQRIKLFEVSRQMELVRETEKLQVSLLNSISHDLRTPLVSIMGALSSLLQDSSSLDTEMRKELLKTAYEDSGSLNRLVGNLLDMTRVEAGALKVNTRLCDLRDVIGTSLQALKDKLEKRDVRINISQNMPEVPMDFTLMMRVFVNLVDNAVKYSNQETPIEITAKLLENEAEIEVKDKGFGIPDEDITRIFDKFYRAVKPRQVTGTGLGLSICKGIVEAHGGRIFAGNNSDKGATLTVILPLGAKKA
jgi:two-component system sensor histidine kinase KdpD